MKTAIRNVGVLAASLMLTACPRPEYPIKAKVEDGRLIFNAYWDGWFRNDPVWADTVRVEDGQRVLWEIKRSGAPQCRVELRNEPFPLTYGVVPPCYVETRPLVPIAIGRPIIVFGAGDDAGQGSFVVGMDRVTEVEGNIYGSVIHEASPEAPGQSNDTANAAPAAAERNAVSR